MARLAYRAKDASKNLAFVVRREHKDRQSVDLKIASRQDEAHYVRCSHRQALCMGRSMYQGVEITFAEAAKIRYADIPRSGSSGHSLTVLEQFAQLSFRGM